MAITRFKDMRIALDSHLNTLIQTSGDNVAWEGVKFNPKQLDIYLRPTLLPAISDIAMLDKTQENTGIYQIDIIARRDTDIADIVSKADEIARHFSSVDSLIENTTKLFIRSISQLGLDDNEAYLYLPIQVVWVSYTTI